MPFLSSIHPPTYLWCTNQQHCSLPSSHLVDIATERVLKIKKLTLKRFWLQPIYTRYGSTILHIVQIWDKLNKFPINARNLSTAPSHPPPSTTHPQQTIRAHQICYYYSLECSTVINFIYTLIERLGYFPNLIIILYSMSGCPCDECM